MLKSNSNFTEKEKQLIKDLFGSELSKYGDLREQIYDLQK